MGVHLAGLSHTWGIFFSSRAQITWDPPTHNTHTVGKFTFGLSVTQENIVVTKSRVSLLSIFYRQHWKA